VEVSGPRNGTVEELAAEIARLDGVIVCGELTSDQETVVRQAPGARLPAAGIRRRRAAALLTLGRARLDRGDVDDPVALEPIYLHAPAARETASG
jgi:hypothetical protein